MPWKEEKMSYQRKTFVMAYLSGGQAGMSELCREYGISRKTGYKWVERFEEGGIPSLEDRSRRPARFREAVAAETVMEIIKVRQWKSGWGGKKIRAYLHLTGMRSLPCPRSIDRILKRSGFVTSRRQRFPRTEGKIKIVKPSSCNDVWTLDIKGWWLTKNGRRCDPLTVRDEFSRYILCLAALEQSTTEAVQEQLEEIFKRYGLPWYIRSDNGAPFASVRGFMGLTRLAVWFLKNDVTPNRIAPASPYMNGAHERMHKDIKADLQKEPSVDAKAEQKRFDIWRSEFNSLRPHQALNDKTPAMMYRSSRRKYKTPLQDFDYPNHFAIRKVSANGDFNWRNVPIRFAKSLAGENIGIQRLSEETLRIWFRNYPIGLSDVDCRKIIPASSFERRPFGRE